MKISRRPDVCVIAEMLCGKFVFSAKSAKILSGFAEILAEIAENLHFLRNFPQSKMTDFCWFFLISVLFFTYF